MKYILMAALVTLSLGCATKKFVGGEIEASEARTNAQVAELKEKVEETQTEIRDLAQELNVSIEGLEENTKNLDRIAKENAQMIVEMGQLRFQKTLSESEANFKSESAELTDGAREQLDRFAQLLVKQNKLVHIEIQGHTDNRGSRDFNMKLGEDRAESVRDYLYKSHDIPLHLMNIISYGFDAPIADNGTKDGRAKNRRVVLVVRLQI